MTPIQIFNTLTRKKELFKTIRDGAVSMYQCGPTVYDTPHIGNYRTFVMDDIVRRVFEYNDYKVTQVMNITDVDDKTIKRSRVEKVALSDVTLKYEKLFMDGLTSLNILRPTHITRATEYIADMIALTQKLLDKGVAYAANDGVYVNISKVKGYGELAHLDLKSFSKERIVNDEYDKENPRDFAVWKFYAPEDGDVVWDAPFGKGRPGWHIECSAMAMKILGPTLDIHTGGTDLVFPHHTNEIAQSESATGETFVHYWIHGGFINVSDEKMAKSKGNFYKLETLAKETISSLAYRYWLLTAHYRSPVNFTFEVVKAAQVALIRLMAAVAALPDGGKVQPECKAHFTTLINDDFDMPKAVAVVWEILKDSKISPEDKRATILDFDRVFGLKLATVPRLKDEPIPEEVKALAEAREDARREKDWKKADALREEIEARGFTVDDTAQGVKITAK